MATKSDPDTDNAFTKAKKRIEVIFDSLIEKVNERREAFLKQLKEWEEEFNKMRSAVLESLRSYEKLRDDMEAKLVTTTLGPDRTSMEQMIAYFEKKICQEENQFKFPEVRFVCDSKDELDSIFSQFGLLTEETENVLVKDYTQISNPVKVFGTFGKGKGEFSYPRGVVIDDNSQKLFIADKGNSRIQVWSMEGSYLSEFGEGILKEPWEIVLSDDSIYISDIEGQFLSKWRRNDFTFVNKSETSLGPSPGQLYYPCGLDIDKKEIFVVEFGNKRISVFDLNLEFRRIMADKAIDHSNCLRVRNDAIYIVENTGAIKLFSKEDQLLKTIPKLPPFASGIYHFNFDSQLNFLLTCSNNSLIFISPDGDLIHSIDSAEFGLQSPFGIGVSKNGSIAIAFQQGTDAIAIF